MVSSGFDWLTQVLNPVELVVNTREKDPSSMLDILSVSGALLHATRITGGLRESLAGMSAYP
jgi:hypothetical protein